MGMVGWWTQVPGSRGRCHGKSGQANISPLNPLFVQTKGAAAEGGPRLRGQPSLCCLSQSHSLESPRLKTWVTSKSRLQDKPCLGFLMSSILAQGFGGHPKVKDGKRESGFTQGICDEGSNQEMMMSTGGRQRPRQDRQGRQSLGTDQLVLGS